MGHANKPRYQLGKRELNGSWWMEAARLGFSDLCAAQRARMTGGPAGSFVSGMFPRVTERRPTSISPCYAVPPTVEDEDA